MSKIKTKESVKDIKVLDKAAVASERMKTALIRSKDQMQNLMDDGQVSPSEYAEDKLRYAAEDVADRVGHGVSSGAKKAGNKGKEAYREHREEKRIQKNEERVRKYEEELRRSAQTSAPQQNAARDTAKKNVETRRANLHSAERSSKSQRLALGIGADADFGMLKEFINNPEIPVIKANDASGITKFFRWVTMSTVARMNSVNPNVTSTVAPMFDMDEEDIVI